MQQLTSSKLSVKGGKYFLTMTVKFISYVFFFNVEGTPVIIDLE